MRIVLGRIEGTGREVVEGGYTAYVSGGDASATLFDRNILVLDFSKLEKPAGPSPHRFAVDVPDGMVAEVVVDPSGRPWLQLTRTGVHGDG